MDNKIEPTKRTISSSVISLLDNLENCKSKLYSSKQTKKFVLEIISNCGLKSNLKIKYVLKLEKLLDKGVNQLEVISSIIYSIKEDFNLLKENDCDTTEIETNRE